MPQQLNNGAAVFAGERVRVRLTPTVLKAGVVTPIKAPSGGTWTVTLTSTVVATGLQAPLSTLTATAGGVTLPVTQVSQGVARITVPAATAPSLDVFLSWAAPTAELRVALGAELKGTLNGKEYWPTVSGLNWRAKTMTRPQEQPPTQPPTTEEAPDGITASVQLYAAGEQD